MSRHTSLSVGTLSTIIVVLLSLLVSSAVWSQDDGDYMDSYTGADAEMTGSAACLLCHSDVYTEEDGPDTHVGIFDADEDCRFYGNGCEACHGPGGNHYGEPEGILNFDLMPEEEITASCTMCHDEVGSFDAEDWEDGRHRDAGATCVSCHSGHVATDAFLVEEDIVALCSGCHVEVGEAFENDEHGVPGSGMTCEACHNPHD